MIPKFTIGNIIKQGIIIAINRTGVVVKDPNTQSGLGIEYKDVEGEPLTTAWLERFGCLQTSISFWQLPALIEMFDIDLRESENGFIISVCNLKHLGDNCRAEILPCEYKYVNEFQNLVYDLTNTELEIK